MYRYPIMVLLSFGAALFPLSASSGEKRSENIGAIWPSEIKARYSLRYNGLEVGRIHLKTNTTTDSYTLSGSGKVSVLFGAFAWSGSSSVSGSIERGAPAPAAYNLKWRGNKKGSKVEIGFSDGLVKDIAVAPPPRIRKDTVPLDQTHKADVLDPLSAILMLTKADGRPPCERSVGIFDGKQRYDIVLTPKKQVRLASLSGKGRDETGYVCRIMYKPVAGHRDNADTKSYASNRDAELILRRIPGSEMLVPYAINIPTPWGTGAMIADRIDVTTEKAEKIRLTN